jgi:hypothetical protein
LAADRSNHAKASFAGGAVGDVLGAAAAIILLIAARRIFGRSRWASPRIIPALLLIGTALAPIAWAGVWANRVYTQDGNNYGSGWGPGMFLSADYPFVGLVGTGLVVAVIVALCALGLRERSAGGVTLLGWTVNMFLYFAQIITQGWEFFPGVAVAVNMIAALLMLATAVLAIIYASRKTADPAAG